MGGWWSARRESERCPAAAQLARRLEYGATRYGFENARPQCRFRQVAMWSIRTKSCLRNSRRDKWVQSSEIRPSSREHVHHAVVYVRPPQSNWLRDAPVGRPFSASSLRDERLKRQAKWTDSDVLLVYAPGSSPDQWRDGMAKLVPAGSDLVFQMHYTTNGHRAEDRTSIGLAFYMFR